MLPPWCISWRPPCTLIVLHLYEVRAAFQACKQHPQWLFEGAYRRPVLIDFPMNASCPPFRSRFPLPHPCSAESWSSESSERRPETRTDVCSVNWKLCACLCKRKMRKVWGRGRRPVGHPSLKGIIGITVVELLFLTGCPVSCLVYIFQHLHHDVLLESFSFAVRPGSVMSVCAQLK